MSLHLHEGYAGFKKRVKKMKKSKIIILGSIAAIALVAITVLITLAIVHKSQNKKVIEVVESVTETVQETDSEMTDTMPENTDYSTVVEEETTLTTVEAETTTTTTTTTISTTNTTTTTKPVVTTTKQPETTKAITSEKPAKGVYTLSLSGDSGVVDVQGAGTYRAGESVTVSTTLLIGYTFRQWLSSDTSLLPNGTTQTYTFTMPAGNVSLKVISYVKPKVTVNAGTGVSSVSGGGSYAIGQSVTVSAVMMQGYDFAGWTSDTDGFGSSQASYTFTMPEQSVSLTATATARTFTVSVKAGNGISGVSGSGQYKVGDKVTINATVKQNYTFSNWSGYSVGNSSSVSTTFTMPGKDITLTAMAKENPKYTITVAKGENGITSVSGGGSFYAGASVTVSCQVASGYVFNGWYSSNTSLLKSSASQSYSFKMPNGSVTLTAKATNNQYTITVSKGTGISSVSGGGKYTVGNSVTVSCQLLAGYEFSGWYSSNSNLLKGSTMQSYSFKMPKGNVTLTAKGVKNTYSLTLQKGTGISAVSGAGSYAVGSAVTVGCTPSTGYSFTGWTSSKTSLLPNSSVQSYSFNMPKGNVTLTAIAEKTQFTVSITKGTGIYRVNGSGTYTAGDTVTVYAEPKSGYIFDKWTKGSSSSAVCTTETYTFTMPKANVSLTARAIQDSSY